VDGKGSDWGQQGFCIDVLEELSPHTPADNSATPSVRLGWTDDGLAFLFTVHDATPIEAETDPLCVADSVEVMVSDASTPPHFVWLSVAPGMDPLHEKLRWVIQDPRLDKNAPANLSVNVASAKTADGYVVEGVIPFSDLNLTAKAGTQIALQVQINDKVCGNG
jgi:hypothetical protein